MDKSLYESARAGCLILTVNDRLSRYLSQQYDLEQQRQGLKAWLRPDILSLAAWLARCQMLIPDMPVFLNKTQLQHVWETIVEADMERAGNYLLQVPQTARRALQAHQLLTSYAARFNQDEAAEDHRAFLRWRKTWQAQAEQHGWHDPVELPWLLAEAIEGNQLPLPAKVVFAGFDELTPDLLHLRTVMATCGTPVDDWQAALCRDIRRQRFAADDSVDEVSRCARWARALLLGNPAARIGVVAPQLEVYRDQIEQLFAAELEPDFLLGGEELPQLFNLSLGRSLDREGVVHAALRLLRIGRQVDQDEISWLLLTPYVRGSSGEQDYRAQIDRELRRLRRFEWNLGRLVKTVDFLASRFSLEVPCLAPLLEEIARQRQDTTIRQPSDWAESFTGFLDKLGWPGGRSLSSREYQAVERFRATLGELASLDGVSKPMNRAVAVTVLSRLAGSVEFQPEGGDGPIQVLGALESSGMTFDHLWVLGLHDSALPRPPGPNPFIPLPVQRRHRMKRADAEREQHFAGQIVARLFSAAPDIVCSWPVREKGTELRRSFFLNDIADGQPPLAESTAPDRVIWLMRPALESVDDRHGPPLATRKAFTGGTGIIKDQALCPFRAFAHHRLKAERLEVPDIGIDSLSRGTLVHSVLELFWAQVVDQATLLSLDAEALTGRLREAAAEALQRLEKERRADLPARQRQIELQRLVGLASQWLEFERRRGDFRVLAAEKSRQVEIGNLVIRTRIDRIDQLEDGTCAVIDYKTGRPDPLQWLDDRISEPQLPAYCLGLPRDQVGAVMFAVLRGKAKESGFRGLARSNEGWPGATSRTLDARLAELGWSSFEEVLEHWDKTLSALGDAFARGDAAVDPVDVELACRYCDLKSFCRIHEQQTAVLESPDD